MKTLITGGAGFIGSNFVYAYMGRYPHDSVTVLDALTYSGHRENLAEAEANGLIFVDGHIEDRELVQVLFKENKFDRVVNFAAETHVDRSIQDPELFIRSNVLGTQTLLDAARNTGVSRFHHISTDEVYGDLGFGSQDSFTENSLLKPSNPYSASKAASDLLVLSYLRTYGLPVTISRCSNNFGPYQSTENLIPLLIDRAMRDQTLPIYGNGKNVRDWLFVLDHCDAIFKILEDGEIGEIYNIGGKNEQENLTVAKLILNELDKPEALIEFVQDRPGHDERYAIDPSKLEKNLGWSPRTSFEEGMRETIAWYTLSNSINLPNHERSYSGWRNRVSALSTHKSHK